MSSKTLQATVAVVAPLLTLFATGFVADNATIGEDATKAIGAALAALAVFAMTQMFEGLPKWSGWYRRRFDPRAAFEGWWLQVHEGLDRVAVFSFLYTSQRDTFHVEGNAFNGVGEHLAHWHSTQVFFADDSARVSYLWRGTSFEQKKGVEREGTTTMSVQRSRRPVQPCSGHGSVLHLNQDRTLNFRMQLVTRQMIRELLDGDMDVDELSDFGKQQQLAIAFLRRPSAGKTEAGTGSRGTRIGSSGRPAERV